jgi:hypothetical protein
MEYLVVLFPRQRRVIIQGQFMGNTNKRLALEGGTYTVSLGPPKNFKPEQQEIDLRNTSALTPLMIEFEEV